MIFICWSDKSKNKREVEAVCDPTWIKAWNEVYLGVTEKLINLQGYCRDDGKARPTKQGLKRFLGHCIRKDLPMRAPVRQAQIVQEPKPEVPLQTRVSFLNQMKATIKGTS